MKKVITILLVLTLVLGLASPAFAGSEFARERYQNTISTEYGETAVVKADGSLWGWGSSSLYGSGGSSTPAKMLDGVVSVSNGSGHAGAVKTDASLWMWGKNGSGQLGTGTAGDPVSTPVRIMDGVQAISCGNGYTLILKYDGTLWGCGRTTCLGLGTDGNAASPVKLMDNVAAVQANSDCAGVLKKDGSLWAWGSLFFHSTYSYTAKPAKLMSGVESFSIAGYGVLAVKPDGSVWHIGLVKSEGVKGGSLVRTYHDDPTKVMDGAASVNTNGSSFAVVKKDGTLWTWGQNDHGQLGTGSTDDKDNPVKVLDNVSAAVLGTKNLYVLKKDGNLWAVGQGSLGTGTYSDSKTFVKVMEGVRLPAVAPAPDIPGVTDRVSYIFKDVSSGAWYEKFLQNAYDAKIVGGTSADTYTPDGNLSHGQIMVMAANLHSRQAGDSYDFQANKKAGGAWYQPYEDYCKAEGIIDSRFDGKETQNVTREEMAYYFAHTLDAASYKDKQEISFNDVAGSAYEDDILTLAKANIVGGMGEGKYAPDALVTRAQASVFISNILDAME